MAHFTATNSKILAKQIDAVGDDFVFSFGKGGRGATWFAHSDNGSMLKTGLTFSEVVNYANYLLELHNIAKSTLVY
jgi:hypothetical protein